MDKRFLCSVLHCLVVFCAPVYSDKWNYDSDGDYGPHTWAEHFPSTCGGDRQSPVDIALTHVDYNTSLGEFVFEGYEQAQPGVFFHIVNNGHAVGVQLTTADGSPIDITVREGALPNTYTLAQFHFHWGNDDSHGSEHHTDSVPYAAELHLVHLNNKYQDMGEAIQYPDGLAVLGIHMKVDGDEDHSGFTGFTEHLDKVKYEGNSTDIPEYAISRMLPENRKDYFRYHGSLTTPACHEAVIWTVFKDPITISHDQMLQFREVINDDMEPISNNYRPPQPLRGRIIQSSFEYVPPESSGAPRVGVVGAVIALLVALLVAGRGV